jgi:hypothetical protein
MRNLPRIIELGALHGARSPLDGGLLVLRKESPVAELLLDFSLTVCLKDAGELVVQHAASILPVYVETRHI